MADGDFFDFGGGASDPGSMGAWDYFKTTAPDTSGFDWGSILKGIGGMGGNLLPAGIGMGQQLMQILQSARAPRQDRPTSPFGGMTGQIGGSADDVRKAMAGKQSQGLTEGGVLSPESIAATMGGGQGGQQLSPELMQIIMQMTQQQGQA